MDSVDAQVRSYALGLGFDKVGVARADEPMGNDFERYEDYLRKGLHGTMAYLAQNVEARRSLASAYILEGAQTVICVAQRYAHSDAQDGARGGIVPRIARYARGRDYHNHVKRKLRKLAAFIGTIAPGTRSRPLCDTAPVLERAWAARAGLGFVGKNGLLIVPGQGSYVLLGEVVTTASLVVDEASQSRCGACTRCLDACPTQAFDSPYVLDSRRCISYLTIEHRGEISPQLQRKIGDHFFGCDVCQEVCPFNRGAGTRISEGGPYEPLSHWEELSLTDLVEMSRESFDAWVQGSALRRAGYEGLKRNARIACENTNRSRDVPDVVDGRKVSGTS